MGLGANKRVFSFFGWEQWRRVVGYDLFYTYSFLDNIMFLDEEWQTSFPCSHQLKLLGSHLEL